MAFTASLTSCERHTVYNHFEHTSISGWERNDTLVFVTSPLSAGSYDEQLALRISGHYPFTSVCLVVEQTAQPTHQLIRDTLMCNLIDEEGIVKGHGVSNYQYLFPLKRLRVADGTTLHIAVHHDMKREILPGITDLGIIIKDADGGSRQASGK